MRLVGVFLLLAAVGCSSAPPPCELDGKYRIVAHESRGDCGPLPDQVDSTDTPDVRGCMQSPASMGPDGDQECVVTYSRTCRAVDGSRVILGVSVQREEDDETWTGAADVELWDPSGNVLCHSLYFLTFIRQ